MEELISVVKSMEDLSVVRLMDDLTDDIKLEIFSRLPTVDSLRCKLVCKSWDTLLSRQKIGLLISIASAWERNHQLFYGDYDEIRINSTDAGSGDFSYKKLPKFNHPLMNKKRMPYTLMVGSCNGLVCLSVPHSGLLDPIYICNPVNQEYFNLPRIEGKRGLIISGFGYHPWTNKYKILRIYYPNRFYKADPPSVGYVDIYTLGDGITGWRSIGEINFTVHHEGILLNGSLYWLETNERKVVAFDLADEKFSVLPTVPPCCFNHEKRSRYQLKMLGGDLCICHQERGKDIDIWSYKINRHNGQEEGYDSWSWSLEFSISGTCNSGYYEPLLLTNNNEILLCHDTTLYHYEMKTATLHKVESVDERTIIFQVIPHINSLLSLKALGVDSKNRMNRRRGPRKKKKSTKTWTITWV